MLKKSLLVSLLPFLLYQTFTAVADNKLAEVLGIIMPSVPPLASDNEALNVYFDRNSSVINTARTSLVAIKAAHDAHKDCAGVLKTAQDAHKNCAAELKTAQDAHKDCIATLKAAQDAHKDCQGVLASSKENLKGLQEALNTVRKAVGVGQVGLEASQDAHKDVAPIISAIEKLRKATAQTSPANGKTNNTPESAVKKAPVNPKAKVEAWLKAFSVVLKKNVSDKKSVEIIANLRKLLPVNPSKITSQLIIDKLRSLLARDLSKETVENVIKQCLEAVSVKKAPAPQPTPTPPTSNPLVSSTVNPLIKAVVTTSAK